MAKTCDCRFARSVTTCPTLKTSASRCLTSCNGERTARPPARRHFRPNHRIEYRSQSQAGTVSSQTDFLSSARYAPRGRLSPMACHHEFVFRLDQPHPRADFFPLGSSGGGGAGGARADSTRAGTLGLGIRSGRTVRTVSIGPIRHPTLIGMCPFPRIAGRCPRQGCLLLR